MPRQNGRVSTPLSRRRTAADETGRAGGGAVVLFCALSIFDEIGGIQRFDRRVLEATMAPGGAPVDRLVVISLRDAQPRQMPKGAIFHACGNSRARFVARFVESLWRHRPTVILFDHVNLVRLAVLARCFPPAPPMALFVHGVEVWNDPTFSRAGLFDPEIIRKCVDTVISVSRYTAATMQREYRLAGRDFRLLPNAVDVDPAAPPHPPPRAAGAGRPFTILSVARLAEATKGIWQVIAAVAKLRRSKIEVVYRVVGDGPLRQELAAFARALGVERAVRFEGLVSDTALAEAYREADAFVLTSTKEGFGIVFLEAWRYGLPVICGRFGASPEVVRDGVDGIAVDPHDIGELAVAIARLIDDAALCRELGEAGYRRVCCDYNQGAFADTYRGILASMVGDHAAPFARIG